MEICMTSLSPKSPCAEQGGMADEIVCTAGKTHRRSLLFLVFYSGDLFLPIHSGQTR
jgi:hypothetical protein